MGGRTIPMASNSPRVAFADTLSLCRPAGEDEAWVMRAFASHASHCPRCSDPYRTYLANDTLCDRGHAKARDVAQYIYNKAGLPFSVTDRVHTGDRVQLEVPSNCESVRGLLKAIDRGLRIHAKSEGRRAAISQDRNYYVSERIQPVRDRRQEAEIYEVRPGNSRREDRRDRERERPRETRYVEGKGSGYRRDELERQRSGRNEDPVIIVAEPRGNGRSGVRYNR